MDMWFAVTECTGTIIWLTAGLIMTPMTARWIVRHIFNR